MTRYTNRRYYYFCCCYIKVTVYIMLCFQGARAENSVPVTPRRPLPPTPVTGTAAKLFFPKLCHAL